MTLDNIKVILSLTEDDTRDELLTVLCMNAINTINVYLGVSVLPDELSFVVDELVVARYRRLGAEGIDTEKIDVLSTKYTADNLKPYYALLDEYKSNNGLSGKRLRML